MTWKVMGRMGRMPMLHLGYISLLYSSALNNVAESA